jgi:hypothetical protein
MAQDDDSFGLPDLNYKPLEPKPETPASPPKVEKKVEKAPTTTTRIQSPSNPAKIGASKMAAKQEEPEDDKSRVIIGILVPVIILVAAYFGYVYLYQKPKEKAKIEQAARDKEAADLKLKADAERLAKEKEEQERLAREAVANAKPAIGTIEQLTAQTGRWYIVAASSIDGDLIMDEAKRKSTTGISTKIIPPYGKWKYYRLTISDYDTFALADAGAKESADQYGGKLWVMKY